MNNKYDFTFFVQAVNCNPNGDPDMGNLPRIDEETMHGFMTDVCIKRNIRNYIENAFVNVPGMDIIMREAVNVNLKIAEAALEVNGGEIDKKVGNKKVKATRQNLCETYFDVRTFGGVLSTGLNGGQVLGPVQFEFARSIDPIYPKDISITRRCYTDNKNLTTLDEYRKLDEQMDEKQKRTMGRKQVIPYGLYVVHGYVSAMEARKTGFSERDLEHLFEAILNMYNSTQSATKAGMSVLSPLIIFKHVGTDNGDDSAKERQAALGCAPAYKLHELIKISKKDDVEFPRTYTDYDICVEKSKLPKGVEVGFKFSPFDEIIWGDISDSWLKIC